MVFAIPLGHILSWLTPTNTLNSTSTAYCAPATYLPGGRSSPSTSWLWSLRRLSSHWRVQCCEMNKFYLFLLRFMPLLHLWWRIDGLPPLGRCAISRRIFSSPLFPVILLAKQCLSIDNGWALTFTASSFFFVFMAYCIRSTLKTATVMSAVVSFYGTLCATIGDGVEMPFAS